MLWCSTPTPHTKNWGCIWFQFCQIRSNRHSRNGMDRSAEFHQPNCARPFSFSHDSLILHASLHNPTSQDGLKKKEGLIRGFPVPGTCDKREDSITDGSDGKANLVDVVVHSASSCHPFSAHSSTQAWLLLRSNFGVK